MPLHIDRRRADPTRRQDIGNSRYEELQAIAFAGIGQRLPQSRSDICNKLEALAREGKLAERVLEALRGFTSGKT